MNEKKIGARIAKMRMDAGLTQAALAEKLGVSDKTVSKWENGGCYPDITVLPAIADEFGVTIDYLLRGEGRKVQKMFFGAYSQVGDVNEALSDGWRVAANPSLVSSDGVAEYIVILEKTIRD